MALSSTTYTGNGVATQFNVPFLYVNKLDIGVTVNGIPVTFTWPDDQTIQITPAPNSGDAILISRTTDTSVLAVDFVDGANLTQDDLNKAYRQTLFYTQELSEKSQFFWDFWGNQIVGGGDLPPSSAENDFMVGDGTGGWVVRDLATIKTTLGITDLEDIQPLPDMNGAFGFLFTDGASWRVLGQKPTRDVLNLGDMAIHNVSEFSAALTTPVGTAVGNLVALADVGGGVAGLPAVDGSQVTNITRELYALYWEQAAYNVGGGSYTTANTWVNRTLTDEIHDEIGASVGSGLITVPAGHYRIRVRTKMRVVGTAFTRVQTDAGDTLATSWGQSNDGEKSIELLFEDTFSESLNLRIQVLCTGAGTDGNDLGFPHGQAALGNNVYTIVEIWKLPT